MFLFNLSLVEFMALLGTVSAVVVALYLFDRARKRRRVATLRFWIPAEKQAEMRQRPKIQQPLSLLLQILSIALLLLALAQLRWGSPESGSRDHVLILDTSAWMGARAQQGTLMDQARAAARAWLRAMPAGDRALLVRADVLATPATAFESNRQVLEEAIARSQPGAGALRLEQAFEFARRTQSLHTQRAGEIVYVGPGRTAEVPTRAAPPNLRVLPVADVTANCGLRKIGLRRSAADPELWEIFVSVRNYGTAPRAVALALAFGGAPAGTRRLTLAPGAEQNAAFEYRTRAAGLLEARLIPRDSFPEDDGAVLELPAQAVLKVTVYSEEPELLRPVLSANPHVAATFRKPSQYDGGAGAQIVVLDRFRPPAAPTVPAIWIEPPADRPPIPIQARASNVALTRWHGDHALGAGLRTKEARLESTQVFGAAPGDIVIADCENGPVIVARAGRPGEPKMVALGFHPLRSSLRYELATPLLFANILRWMSPEIFRQWELTAESVGTVSVPTDTDGDPANLKVTDEAQRALPFTLDGRTLRFFSGTPGTVRVQDGSRERVYSLTLPDVAESSWTIPASVRRGVPQAGAARAVARDLWQWLALLGGLGLLAEWLIFGRRRALPASGGSRVAGATILSSLGRRIRTPKPARKAS